MANRTLQMKRSLADPRHLMRYLKSKTPGGTPEAIAKSEGVSVATVKQSISMIDTYRNMNTSSEMDLAIRDFVISTIPQAKETLNGLLTAMEMVEYTDSKTGKKKTKEVEDKTTRLEAVRVVNALIGSLQPKQAPVEVRVSQTNQMAAIGSAETMEERLARLRRKAEEANLLPAETIGVPDYIDKDEEAPDNDEDEEEE